MNAEQISKLGDFELNKAIVRIIYKYLTHIEPQCLGAPLVTFVTGVYRTELSHDYCTNPADIMPLAIEAGISLISPRETQGLSWRAYARDYKPRWIEIHRENPYRALAECYLLVKQGEDTNK